MNHSLTLSKLKDFLQQHKEELKHRFQIEKIGVFGSMVKQQQSEESDIDILVEFQDGGETFRNYMGLKFFLEDSVDRNVDLVTIDTINPIIKEDVLREVVYA